MANFKRTARLNEQLRQEISLVLRHEVSDPRVALATITGVETSPELDHARVYVTALGEDEDREEVVEGLRSAAAYIRGHLGRRLHIRRIPELHFEVDRQLDEAQRIENLLRQVRPESDGSDTDEGDASLAGESASEEHDDRGSDRP